MHGGWSQTMTFRTSRGAELDITYYFQTGFHHVHSIPVCIYREISMGEPLVSKQIQ